jgi:hypothetical protein
MEAASEATHEVDSIGALLSTLVLPVRNDTTGKLTPAIPSHCGVRCDGTEASHEQTSIVREYVIPGVY